MRRLLVDTNIIIDLLAKREAFYESAAQLFSLADQKKVELYVCSLSFANAHYILSRQLSEDKVREILRKLKVLVNVIAYRFLSFDVNLFDMVRDNLHNTHKYYSRIV